MSRRSFSAEPHAPKYRQVFESSLRDILSGKYRAGPKVPERSGTGATVPHLAHYCGPGAMRELAQRGLVESVAGSGTYVRDMHPAQGGMVFGLLIPDLGSTEVFEPICRGIAAAPRASRHALLWGHAAAGGLVAEEQALELCGQSSGNGARLEFSSPRSKDGERHGKRISRSSRSSKQARIPIVLLDRCVMPYPGRSPHDLVGIDNRRAGYMATGHS